MAVMHSAEELFSTDPFERQFGWAHCYRNILTMEEMVGKDRFHLVRYEDLIVSPQKVLGLVFDFLGVRSCDSIRENIHKHSVDKWKQDPGFTLQLHDSVIRVAAHFGYTEEDVYNPSRSGFADRERPSRRVQCYWKLAKARLIYRYIKPFMLSVLRRK